MHPFAPLPLSAIAVAATAPLGSAFPVATAQVPTLASAPVAVTVRSTDAEDPSVTVTGPVVGVAAGVPDPRNRPPVSSRPETVTVDPDTAVTFPNAVAKFWPPPPPARPGGGLKVPDGRGRGVRSGLAVPPARVGVQLPPVETTRTDVAESADPVPGVPVAVTQSPTAIVAGTAFVNAVDADQVTAVCDCVFCTCSVFPVTAAISPNAAGPRPRPGAPGDPVVLGAGAGAAAALSDVDDPPPQPASSRRATGRPVMSATTVGRFTATPLWTEGIQSLRSASMGASRAARPAG